MVRVSAIVANSASIKALAEVSCSYLGIVASSNRAVMDSFAVGRGRERGESAGGESMGAITADICRVRALVTKPTILQIQRDADIDIVPVNFIPV